jgi:DNA-binding transcriptional regulator/RsmH inhibitor MraZ
VIIGVNERLEIWSLEDFNDFMNEHEESLEEITENLFESEYHEA